MQNNEAVKDSYSVSALGVTDRELIVFLKKIG